MATRKAIALINGLFEEINTPTDKVDLAGNTTTDLAEGTNLLLFRQSCAFRYYSRQHWNWLRFFKLQFFNRRNYIFSCYKCQYLGIFKCCWRIGPDL
jgi:hypothetical protein